MGYGMRAGWWWWRGGGSEWRLANRLLELEVEDVKVLLLVAAVCGARDRGDALLDQESERHLRRRERQSGLQKKRRKIKRGDLITQFITSFGLLPK